MDSSAAVTAAFERHNNDGPRHQQLSALGRPKPLTANPAVSTIVAKVVAVTELRKDGETVRVKKYGFALAGNVKLNYYQLLVYGAKSSVLVNLALSKRLVYGVRENDVVEFWDDNEQTTWRLQFSNADDAVDFNWHVAFALWKLIDGPNELFWMDLHYEPRHGGSSVATFGSALEIAFVANTVHGKTIGPEVSNNVNDGRYLKVNVSEHGWARALLGVNVGTKRIVYIPAAEMGAWKILTDGGQSLCLSVIVEKVYAAEEQDAEERQPVDALIDEPLDERSAASDCKATRSNANSLASFPAEIPCGALGIDTLYQEFEEFRIENAKTNDRLTRLEELVQQNTRTEKVKDMKTLYKTIVQEFPADQTFSGSQIQTKIKDIFYNSLFCSKNV